jgi:hypothetical protein
MSGETVTDNCDAAPSGVTWSCCYDLNSEGKTGSCECAAYGCQSSDTSCNCIYLDGQGSGFDLAPSECTKTRSGSHTFAYPGVCCDTGSYCQCEANDSSTGVIGCGAGTEVASCGQAAQHKSCSAFGHGPQTSCADLIWK